MHHTFTGGADGGYPVAGVIRDQSGNLYGTTQFGGDTGSSCSYGSFGCGVVFRLNPAGAETVLYTFTGAADGYRPVASLPLRDGSLYGTASFGGTYNYGVVFRLR